jgi:tetratricopeptide (TPR) repeat protein
MRLAGLAALSVALAVLAGMPTAGQADAISELDDLAARIQYGFYTGDPRGIEEALSLLERLDLPPARKVMKDYYAAYGHWKRAQLYIDEAAAGRRTARAEARNAGSACEKAASAAIAAAPSFAEAHAIHAVCATLASRTAEMLSLGTCAKDKAMREAQALEPKNLRVRLIEIECTMADGKQAASVLSRLETLVKDFDDAPPTSPGNPDWGHAEALVLLGRLRLAQGNTIGARDALERAIVIAPDYRKAQALLRQVSTGAR